MAQDLKVLEAVQEASTVVNRVFELLSASSLERITDIISEVGESVDIQTGSKIMDLVKEGVEHEDKLWTVLNNLKDIFYELKGGL